MLTYLVCILDYGNNHINVKVNSNIKSNYRFFILLKLKILQIIYSEILVHSKDIKCVYVYGI